MYLKIIGSGSSGNCYLLKGINEDLMIETGGYNLSWNTIKKALNYDFKRIKYCLLSHEHQDHAGNYDKVAEQGISIFTSQKTNKFSNNSLCSSRVLETDEFKITRFDVEHDAVDPQGFMIESKTEFKKIVFITDSYYCKYDFCDEAIDYFMIEVNYQKDLLRDNEETGLIDRKRADRVRKSHFELNNAIKFINGSKSTNTKAVIPIHMSKENLDLDFAKERIELKTGIPVFINISYVFL